jgi:hypothetical protein
MTFTPKEVILGATVPLTNGSTITFSIAGHVEAERDYDDEVFCPVKDGWLAESERIEQDLAWAWGDDLPEFVSLAQDPEGCEHET